MCLRLTVHYILVFVMATVPWKKVLRSTSVLIHTKTDVCWYSKGPIQIISVKIAPLSLRLKRWKFMWKDVVPVFSGGG